jgi:hypothetical protein
MAIRIGEYLVSIKLMTEEQVAIVLAAQKAGDTRKFGVIAVSKGLVEDSAILRYSEFLAEHQDTNP